MKAQPAFETQAETAKPAAETAPATQPKTITILIDAATLAKLGIDLATATDAEIGDAVLALLAKSGAEGGTVATLQQLLDAANVKIGELTTEMLADELGECGLDDAAIQVIAGLPAAQRDTMIAMFKKKAAPVADVPAAQGTQAAGAAAGTQAAPPPPIHTTAGDAAPDAAGKAKELDALIKSIQSAPRSKFKDYTGAREQARRQRADLFA